MAGFFRSAHSGGTRFCSPMMDVDRQAGKLSDKEWRETALVTRAREIHVARYNSTVAYTNLDEAVPALKVLFA